MDSELDNALIQSEALYCLRREQLVNLCKRRGIKARGKASELADLLRQSIQDHQATSPKPLSPALAESPQRSLGASSPFVWSPPMHSRSPAFPSHAEQSSPKLPHRTAMDRTTSRLSTRSRFSHASPNMDALHVDLPSSPVSINALSASRCGYNRCANPQLCLPETLPMQVVSELANEGTGIGINLNISTEKESVDPANTSEDALDWLINAIDDDPDASKNHTRKVKSSSRVEPNHDTMDHGTNATKKERPASAMELRRQDTTPLGPASPLPRPTTSLDDARAISQAHACSAAQPMSSSVKDIPSSQATSVSHDESGTLTSNVTASPRSCSPMSRNETRQYALSTDSLSHDDKAKEPLALAAATNVQNDKDISKIKFPKVSKMARRMRSILETSTPAQSTHLNEFLHPKTTKRVKYAQAEYEGVADPVMLRQALYSSSRMPTTTVPVIYTSRTEADENKPPMAIERARSLRTTRKIDATRRSVQGSATAVPTDKRRFAKALR